MLRCSNEREETYSLRYLWKRATPSTTFVTFNGLDFDLPLVLRRSLYLQVPAPEILLGKYPISIPK